MKTTLGISNLDAGSTTDKTLKQLGNGQLVELPELGGFIMVEWNEANGLFSARFESCQSLDLNQPKLGSPLRVWWRTYKKFIYPASSVNEAMVLLDLLDKFTVAHVAALSNCGDGGLEYQADDGAWYEWSNFAGLDIHEWIQHVKENA